MAVNCSKLIETSIGTLRPIGQCKTYDEAVKYCRESGAQLASIHDQETFQQLLSQPGGCLSSRREFERGEFWNIGLKLNDGQGRWHDGTIYRPSEHRDLFLTDPAEKGCQIQAYNPFSQFQGILRTVALKCNQTAKFLCVEMDNSNGRQGGNVAKFTLIALIFVIAMVALFMFLLFLKRKAKEPPTEHHTEYTDVAPNYIDDTDDGGGDQASYSRRRSLSGPNMVDNEVHVTISGDDVTDHPRVYEQINEAERRSDGGSKSITDGSSYIV